MKDYCRYAPAEGKASRKHIAVSFSGNGFSSGEDEFLKSFIISIFTISHSSESCVYSYLPGAHFYQVEKHFHQGFQLERNEAEHVNREAQVVTSLMLQFI